jgi:hypothetical protein
MITKYDIAANLTLAGLDGFTGVLSAVIQRQMFGFSAYGRKTIRIDCSGQGNVSGKFRVCFGADSSVFSHSFDEIAAGNVRF